MNGTVTRVRPRGVDATMTTSTAGLAEGTLFKVTRVVNSQTVEIAQVELRRILSDTELRLNLVVPVQNSMPEFLVGDSVESV